MHALQSSLRENNYRTNIYHKLLEEFEDVTRLEGFPRETKHIIRHHIETTPGPPVVC